MANITTTPIPELPPAGVGMPSDSESLLNETTKPEPVYGGTLNFGFTNQFLTFTSILTEGFVKLAFLDLLAGLADLAHSIVTDFDADSSSADISNSEKLTLNFGFTNQFLTFTSILTKGFVKLAFLDLLAGLAGLAHSIVTDFDADSSSAGISNSDGDKIPDPVEAGSNQTNPADTNSDVPPDFQQFDSDADKIIDPVEAGSNQTNPADTNSDGTANFQQLDSLPDAVNNEVEVSPGSTVRSNVLANDSDPKRQDQELLDLTSLAGQQVQAEFSVFGNSLFDNRGGLDQLADASAEVPDPLTGAPIAPGEKGYTEAALAQSAVQFDESDNGLTAELEGGGLYTPYLLADGQDTYFPFLEANADGVDHLRLLGYNTFGLEDLSKGGDFSDFSRHLFG